MFVGRNSYFVNVTQGGGFPVHRHHETELSFCIKGSYDIMCDDRMIKLKAGDLLIIPPMCMHEFTEYEENTEMLTMEFGAEFLGEYHEKFLKCEIAQDVQSLEASPDPHLKKLYELFMELVQMRKNREEYPEMFVKGNLYLIGGIIYNHLLTDNGNNFEKRESDISKIDSVFEFLYSNYDKPITIKDISTRFGYGESNFCKTFKKLTGTTFHSVLNQHRIDIACEYLARSDLSIEEIAVKTGFSDAKSFCRVFKNLKDQTPGNYRKRSRI